MLEDQNPIEQLIQDLASDNEWVATKAAQLLGGYTDKAAISALLKVLKDTTSQIELDRQVEKIPVSRGAIALVEHLGGDISELRAQSARSLGKIGDNSVISSLLEILSIERDLRVKAAIIWSLGELNAVESVPVLTAMMSDSNERTKNVFDRSIGDYTQEALLKICARV